MTRKRTSPKAGPATAAEPAIDVIVTVETTHLDALDALCSQLAVEGLANAQPLASAGLVIGCAPASRLAALRAVRGVAAVEASGPVQLAPPDSDIQ